MKATDTERFGVYCHKNIDCFLYFIFLGGLDGIDSVLEMMERMKVQSDLLTQTLPSLSDPLIFPFPNLFPRWHRWRREMVCLYCCLVAGDYECGCFLNSFVFNLSVSQCSLLCLYVLYFNVCCVVYKNHKLEHIHTHL